MKKKAIAILSAGIKNEDGTWRSTNFSDDEKWGAPGGNLRILAGSILYKENPNLLVISCGGRGHDIKVDNINRPLISKIIKNELVKTGVNSKDIIEENRSNTTFEALCNIVECIKKYKITAIDIISNRYHLERIQAFINTDQRFREAFGNIITNILAAEDIVINHDHNKWQSKLKIIYASKRMKERFKKEQEGIDDIRNGNYRY